MTNHDIIKSRGELLRRIGKVQRAVEVGVLNGDFARRIAAACDPDQFYLVDTWGSHLASFNDYKDYTADRWARMKARVQKWAEPYGYAVMQCLSTVAAKTFPDKYFDFVYIDADHERAYEDILAWLPKVRPGGVIAGHDYIWNPGKKQDAVGAAVRAVFGYDFGHTHEALQSWWHIVK